MAKELIIYLWLLVRQARILSEERYRKLLRARFKLLLEVNIKLVIVIGLFRAIDRVKAKLKAFLLVIKYSLAIKEHIIIIVKVYRVFRATCHNMTLVNFKFILDEYYVRALRHNHSN